MKRPAGAANADGGTIDRVWKGTAAMQSATVVDVNPQLDGLGEPAPPLPRPTTRRAVTFEVVPMMVAGAIVGVSLRPWDDLPSSMDGATPTGGA